MALRELIPWKRKELSAGKEVSPFDSLQREMARVFERFTHGFGRDEPAKREEWWGSAFPTVDVAERDKEILVTAELPGLDEKDLEVTLSGNHIHIRGEKEEKGEHYYHKESSYGAFHRAIPLPAEVEEDNIEATYKKGVLKIKLPKSAEALKTRKKISIH